MPTTDKSQSPAVPGLIVGQTTSAQNPPSQMPGFGEVQQQIAGLRQTLQGLMGEAQYADGETVSAAATLDAQLEDFSRRLADKKQPGMRTF